MKLTVLIVACMAIVAVQTASIQNAVPVADKALLEKQKLIFEMVYRVDEPLMFEEWIKLGEKFVTDRSVYLQFNDWMVNFINAYKSGGLVPQGEFFSITQRIHIQQALGLFNLFYYANSWEVLVHNIAWARLNVNPGMFVYALSLAVIHRDDMQGIILPQIYEIRPQLFLSSKYIVQAEKFDWDVFNRQIMLEKELISAYEQDPAAKIFGKSFYLRDWKVWQWWRLMGLDDGWHVEGTSMIRENIQVLQNDPIWASIYSNLKMAWLPVDYTRDIEIMNDDSVLSYFTEDVGLNAYWYYLNLDYSKGLPAREFGLDKDRRGEWWVYNVQQILARYYMERLANGLGEIPSISWYGQIATGYNPQLIAPNGNSFSVRNNNWQIDTQQNQDILNKIVNLERRIYDIINSGQLVLRNGTVIDMTLPQSIGLLGDLLQGNIDVPDSNILGYWWFYTNPLLSGEQYQELAPTPNVLLNYETMLRDPLTFILLNLPATMVQQSYYQLPAYTNAQLLLPGVEINDVVVSKLMTYFDLVDLDITTLLNNKMVIHDGNLVWDKTLLARQMRLNHEPFQYDIKVNAVTAQKVVVRTFLAPEFDQYGQKISLYVNRENFLEIDEFIAELAVGENSLLRSSEDFSWTSGDPLTYSELYNNLMAAFEGKTQFQLNITQPHSLFPDRLILPRGSVAGMPMALFFMISPYTADVQQFATYDPSWQSGIGSGVRHIDNMPFGYPLERKIDNLAEFFVPNMFLKHVKIYHLEKYNKYFPIKYENYGSFDYNY